MVTGELIGLLIALVSMLGGLIARDRQMAKMISEGDTKCHNRINKLAEDTIRKDDLKFYTAAVEKSVDRMIAAQEVTNQRIDNLLTTIIKTNSS